MKHIAIDASRTTVARVTGTESYALHLIRVLIALNHEHHITLYFRDTPSPELFPSHPLVTHCVIPAQRAWTHTRFAWAISQTPPDITFVPAHTLPFIFRGKSAVTVHDLGYKYFPHAHPFKDRAYLDLTTRYSAHRADIVFADSHATAHDLTRFYGTPSDKIRVIYPAVEPLALADSAVVRAKYHLPERYFLFLGTLQPRKNIARIVQAFAQYRAEHGAGVDLVLAGGQGWLFDPSWVAGVEGVHLIGYVDDADKGALYTGAEALVFPSLYEGFGFPVLEAFGCGTPVIASQTSSLPELVGTAGLLVDPLDVSAIAHAMSHIHEKSDKTAMRQQVEKFTWADSARQVLDSFEAEFRK